MLCPELSFDLLKWKPNLTRKKLIHFNCLFIQQARLTCTTSHSSQRFGSANFVETKQSSTDNIVDRMHHHIAGQCSEDTSTTQTPTSPFLFDIFKHAVSTQPFRPFFCFAGALSGLGNHRQIGRPGFHAWRKRNGRPSWPYQTVSSLDRPIFQLPMEFGLQLCFQPRCRRQISSLQQGHSAGAQIAVYESKLHPCLVGPPQVMPEQQLVPSYVGMCMPLLQFGKGTMSAIENKTWQ